MLYFSKIKIISIIIVTTIFVYLTASNFFKFDNNFLEKKINLGLDLQGGSYLLLEIDNKPVITQRLQNKLTSLRKYFKKENINFKNLKIINNEKISFELNQEFVENFYLMLEDKHNVYLNPYYQRFNSHEFDFIVEDKSNIYYS